MEALKPAVLIVDDEEHVLRSLKRLLRRDGYVIHSAERGADALEILAREDVSVIICDQRMPEMSGAEVLAESYRLYPDTVRITLTGYTDLAAAQASINEGHVNHFLLKPWDDENLRSIVREGVQSHQLVIENRRLVELTKKQKEELEAWNHRLEEQVEQRTELLRAQNERLHGLQGQLEQSLRDTVNVIVGILEATNPNIDLHSKRVAEHSLVLGRKLNLSEEELRDVEFAARLHDIGKVSKIHGAKVTRPARSTSARGHTPLRHSDSGFAILSHVHGFEEIAQAVRHQYEEWSGTGHPDRLTEDEIPLASRIVALADSYDEAVFSTTYPTHASRDAGKKALLVGQGKRFDPTLVEMFLEHIERESAGEAAHHEVELSPSQLQEGMKLSRPLENSDGVLLLKSGTALTDEMIERVRLASNIDPVLGGVFVRCSPDAEKDGESKDADAAATDKGSGADGAGSRTTSPRSGSSGATGGARSEGPSADGADRPSAESSANRKPTILIVDDAIMLCNALKRELRSCGYNAVTTDNGYEALTFVKHETFDAAITDVMMPAMSGEELLRRLHELKPDLPCIVLTGNANMDQVRRIATAPNVVGILVKPWEKVRLLEALNNAMTSRQTESVETP